MLNSFYGEEKEMEKKNNKKGFTLVELVIVVAVMAILVAVAIPTVSSITNSAKGSVDKTNAQTIESMIKLAQAKSNTTLDADAIDKALSDAKLGITSGSYVYDPASGACFLGSSAGTTQFVITFTNTTGNDAVKVAAGTASSPVAPPAETTAATE